MKHAITITLGLAALAFLAMAALAIVHDQEFVATVLIMLGALSVFLVIVELDVHSHEEHES